MNQMAYQRPTPILFLIFVVFIILVGMKCEARSLEWKKIDGRLLPELGNTNLEMQNYLRGNGINPVRVTPGGPNPLHHASEPTTTP